MMAGGRGIFFIYRWKILHVYLLRITQDKGEIDCYGRKYNYKNGTLSSKQKAWDPEHN